MPRLRLAYTGRAGRILARMVTTREWWRHGLRAWGASALVPTAVLIAVAVLAIGGGVGGVRSLGQLFSGPAVPSPVGSAGNVDVSQQEQIAVPRIPRRVLSAAGPAAASVRATPVPTRRSGTSHSRSSGPQPTSHPSPGTSRPVTPTTPPVATTPQPPTPPAPPHRTITDRLGSTLDKVLAPVPLVGPTATKAIDAVVTTVDKILPLPPSSARLLAQP